MDNQKSRNLSAREAVDGIRGQLSNGELMARFKISPRGFADLLKQLFELKMINEEDMLRRGIKFKVQKKQSDITETAPPIEAPAPVFRRPAPVEENEEFLDTVELAELLSFKPAPTKAESETEIAQEEAKPDLPPEKKAKFTLTGLFKKK